MNIFAHLKSKPEMLSANDLLEIFPISRSGIYDLLREPGFPCIHLGRRIIVPRDAMIDWLENRLQEELNSAAKSRESNEVSVMPETSHVSINRVLAIMASAWNKFQYISCFY